MEKKNVLLVIGSVTLFLIVVLAAGLWLFWPEPKPESSGAAVSVLPFGSEGTRPFDTFEYYRGRQELPGLEPRESVQPGAPAQPQQPDVVPLSIGETPPQPSVSVAPRPSAAAPQPAPRQAPAQAPAASAAPSAPRARPAAQASPRPATPRLTRVNEYWIQAGSYRSRVSAEGLNKKLADLGLPGTITTRDVGGETYFRVRIGPYTSSAEAAKFLSVVKGVQGLSDSYVSRVTRTLTS
jgi:cell division septation protein DedD